MITVGVGQHQMWAAQYYKFTKPRTFLSSSGLGTMGFGLPAAMGVQSQFPGRLVVDIDGDGSFQMNIQELGHLLLREAAGEGAAAQQPAPRHGGAVGRPLHAGQPGPHLSRPDRQSRKRSARATASVRRSATRTSCRSPRATAAARRYVRNKADLVPALKEMIEYDGPYVLDVEVPYQEHVLPMIPTGMTVRDIIKE